MSDFWVCGPWHECFLVDWSSRLSLRTNDLVPDVVSVAFVPGFWMLCLAYCGGTASSHRGCDGARSLVSAPPSPRPLLSPSCPSGLIQRCASHARCLQEKGSQGPLCRASCWAEPPRCRGASGVRSTAWNSKVKHTRRQSQGGAVGAGPTGTS